MARLVRPQSRHGKCGHPEYTDPRYKSDRSQTNAHPETRRWAVFLVSHLKFYLGAFGLNRHWDRARGCNILRMIRMRRLDVELADPAALKGGWQPQLSTSS